MLPVEIALVLIAITGLLGVGFGYFLRFLLTIGKRSSLDLEIKQLLLEAREKAEQIKNIANQEAEQITKTAQLEAKQRDEEIKITEERLIKREEILEERHTNLDQEISALRTKTEATERMSAQAAALKQEYNQALEKITGLSAAAAKEEMMAHIAEEYQEDLVVRLRKMEQVGQEKLEARAREIITTIIHRLASNIPAETMATSLTLSNDDIKGKIIGKEGRNIKAFERATGVELIIDDTPNTVTISSFDPLRRQVAAHALEELVHDGRIQPARIEEAVAAARDNIDQLAKEKGEAAAYETGIINLDPRITSILGRLYFRTSYGQNVLQHSIEVAHIAGMLATELGADIMVAKAGGLLHDIGKALDHEVAGTHVNIGIRILEKFHADKRIITAMKSHHEDYPYETLEAYIVQVADTISASRPGARRDNVENYLKRLTELERLASRLPGVDKCYAVQAGREIRVFVNPEQISDLEAHQLARDIATSIEQELHYPGEIKVHVIRETHTTEYAR